ncbi:junctional adhesion molecule 2A-like [Palaemon carinicauda]|uniref:junctional adhesion molecule 2A-like n=1 Tax=Palaemon carinicauda TaxID=392227 RepID=UPI0035B5F9FF
MCRGKRTNSELFGILTVMATLVSGSVSIRIEKVLVPPRVQAGETVQLSCLFDLEGKKLYSLNWWRGSEQFFQFSPNSQEQILIYDSPGIEIDKDRSGGEKVVLRNVSRATSGKFKCEVLAESFEKDFASTSMEVIEVPDRPPSVSVTRLQWSPGQVLSANCTSPDARPPPDLHWYINGDKLPPQHSQLLTQGTPQSHHAIIMASGMSHTDMSANEIIPSRAMSRTSELSLVLRSTHFHRGGTAVLTCTAALQGLYYMSTNVTLTLPGFRSPAPSQKLYGCAHTKGGSMGLILTVAAFLVMLHL